MTTPSNQNNNSSLYDLGTMNPKSKKSRKEKTQTQLSKISNSLSSVSCNQKESSLEKRTPGTQENHKIHLSDLKKNHPTNHQKSQEKFKKELNESIRNITRQEIPNKTGSTNNHQRHQHKNEEDIDSLHKLAIQSNASLSDSLQYIKGLSELKNLAYTKNSKLTQRQQYNQWLQNNRNELRFRIQKPNRNTTLWNMKYFQKQYSFSYQTTFPVQKNLNLWNKKCWLSKELNKLVMYSLNIDTIISKVGSVERYQRKKYPISQADRIKQIMDEIYELMKTYPDFIYFQQLNSQLARTSLLALIKRFNSQKKDEPYFYPKNLEQKKQFQTTMILSKHNVEMGQFSFSIMNRNGEIQHLPQQSFCEFKINGKDQTVCIFNCHLKSNRGSIYSKDSIFIRKQQIDQIHNFRSRYTRFYCVGDMNIGQTQQYESDNKYAATKFHDAVLYGLSQKKGSYLYQYKQNQKTDQRVDRVWVDKENATKTKVKIQYVDLLIDSFKGDQLERQDFVTKENGQYILKTLSDHSMLKIQIELIS